MRYVSLITWYDEDRNLVFERGRIYEGGPYELHKDETDDIYLQTEHGERVLTSRECVRIVE
jgi:hypothetical protein